MALTPARAARVKKLAKERGEAALVAAGLTSKAKLTQLRPSSQEGIHRGAKEFANAVVWLEHKRSWGTKGYIDAKSASNIPLMYVLSLASVPGSESDLYGCVSWLYFGKRTGSFGAVLFEDLVSKMFVYRKDVELYRFYLFLHEIGHMLLHRKRLWKQVTTSSGQWNRGTAASLNMEYEADLAARCFANCLQVDIPESFYWV